MDENEKTDKTNTEDNPIKHSFLIAGEPESNLDMDKVPDEEQDIHEKAEEEWRSTRSFAGLSSIEDDEKDDKEADGKDGEEEPEDSKKTPDNEKGVEDQEAAEPEKKSKKKVKFKNPFDEEKAPEPEDGEPFDQKEAEPTKDQKQPEQEQDKEEPDAFGYTDEDKSLLNALPPSAKESVEFWQDAENADPKYKGYAKRQLDYLRKHKDKVDELRDKDPDTPIEENPQYVTWVKRNKPSITGAEKRRLDREIVINEAKKRLKEEQGKDIEDLRSWKEQQEFERKNGPELEKRSQQFASNLVNELEKVADEPMKLFREKLEETGDPTKAGQAMSESFPDEAEIIARNHRAGKTMADELLKLRMGFKKPDLENNEMHKTLAQRIVAQEQAMMKPNMKSKRQRDGKMFVPASQFAQMDDAQRSKHWTYSDNEILNFLSAETLHRTQRDLENHKKNVDRILQRYGKSKNSAQNTSKSSSENKEEKPRHEGADSPASSRRSSGEGKDEGSGSKLINWDF